MPDRQNAQEYVQMLYDNLNQKLGISTLIVDIKEAWVVLLVMGCLTIVMTVLYMFLLNRCAKPILYLTILAVEAVLILIGIFAYLRKDAFSPDS
jgi:predicted RND superfamily exporter protein